MPKKQSVLTKIGRFFELFMTLVSAGGGVSGVVTLACPVRRCHDVPLAGVVQRAHESSTRAMASDSAWVTQRSYAAFTATGLATYPR